MEFEEVKEVLLGVALILIGAVIRFSKNKEVFGVFERYGLWFIVGGGIVVLLKIIKFCTRI